MEFIDKNLKKSSGYAKQSLDVKNAWVVTGGKLHSDPPEEILLKKKNSAYNKTAVRPSGAIADP